MTPNEFRALIEHLVYYYCDESFQRMMSDEKRVAIWYQHLAPFSTVLPLDYLISYYCNNKQYPPRSPTDILSLVDDAMREYLPNADTAWNIAKQKDKDKTPYTDSIIDKCIEYAWNNGRKTLTYQEMMRYGDRPAPADYTLFVKEYNKIVTKIGQGKIDELREKVKNKKLSEMIALTLNKPKEIT